MIPVYFSTEYSFPMGEPYVHPEVLVSADWVADHLKDTKVRIVESDEDLLLFARAISPARS